LTCQVIFLWTKSCYFVRARTQWSSSNSNKQRILLFLVMFLVILFVMQPATSMKRRDKLRILLRAKTVKQQQQGKTENLVILFDVSCNVWRVQLYFYEQNLGILFVSEQWSSSNSNEQRILWFHETFLIIPFVMQSTTSMKRRDELRIFLYAETVKQ